jgi:hypothetical protein
MGVPTVVRILPAGADITDPVEGPTGGRHLVEIDGNNFRLPPEADDSIGGDVPKTVSVTFDGTEAPVVDVVRTNLLRIQTPISPLAAVSPDFGAGLVDVVITNLDDNGDAIPGETITLVDGYKYRRPRLDATTESDLLRLVRTFIHSVKKQVLPEVVLTTNTDFDSDTTDGLNIVDIAQLPSIVLQGPETPINRFYSVNQRIDEEISPGVVHIRRVPKTVDLNFAWIGMSNSTMELVNLMTACYRYMQDNPFITMDRDPSDPSKGTVDYEFDFQPGGSFEVAGSNNNSNVRNFSGSVVIRGFDIEGYAGTFGQDLADLTTILTDPVNFTLDPS